MAEFFPGNQTGRRHSSNGTKGERLNQDATQGIQAHGGRNRVVDVGRRFADS